MTLFGIDIRDISTTGGFGALILAIRYWDRYQSRKERRDAYHVPVTPARMLDAERRIEDCERTIDSFRQSEIRIANRVFNIERRMEDWPQA